MSTGYRFVWTLLVPFVTYKIYMIGKHIVKMVFTKKVSVDDEMVQNDLIAQLDEVAENNLQPHHGELEEENAMNDQVSDAGGSSVNDDVDVTADKWKVEEAPT